jgi:DNA-binding HxlR family transcriptional regulator
MEKRPHGPDDAGGRLADLCHHRWAVPVLAELHRRSGAKFVTLQKALGVSPDSLRRTLEGLDARGLACRNPGYGHPMRPEWILTPAGARLGPACLALRRGVRRIGMEEVAGRKWAFPVLLALRPGEARFSELERTLPGVTPRALTITLRDMEGAGLVSREVAPSRPPSVTYRASGRARRLLPALADLSDEA